jgi:hypothetical protein
MPLTLKKTLAALATVALIPTAASAWTVKAPHPGTVSATTYESSGAFHGAVDVASNNGCAWWGVETGVVGSISWNVTIHVLGPICYGSGTGTGGGGNEAKHVFGDGWTFRLLHFIKTASSVDKVCDRCQIGDAGTEVATGSDTHLQRDKNGTKDTSWYAGYTVKGEAVDRTETLGIF